MSQANNKPTRTTCNCVGPKPRKVRCVDGFNICTTRTTRTNPAIKMILQRSEGHHHRCISCGPHRSHTIDHTLRVVHSDPTIFESVARTRRRATSDRRSATLRGPCRTSSASLQIGRVVSHLDARSAFESRVPLQLRTERLRCRAAGASSASANVPAGHQTARTDRREGQSRLRRTGASPANHQPRSAARRSSVTSTRPAGAA